MRPATTSSAGRKPCAKSAIIGNKDTVSGIIRYALAQMPFTETHYYPWPSKVYLHDNTYMNNGTMPDLASTIGVILSTGMSAYPGGHVPDVLWDGIADRSLPARRRPTHPPSGVWAM